MAGTMKKMAVYLGLVEDDRYDDFYDDFESDSYDAPESRDSRDDLGRAPRSYERSYGSAQGSDYVGVAERSARETAAPAAPSRDWRNETTVLDPVPAAPASAHPAATRPAPRPTRSHDPKRITTFQPHSYNDARRIGEEFRGGVPVIMDLTELEDADAKRLVDFAAGLVFGVRGSIERVSNKVFMLTPADLEVSAEDARARLRDSVAARA